MNRFAAVALAIAALASSVAAEAASETVLIQDVTVIPMTEDGGAIEHQDVLILDQKFNAIGPTGTLQTPIGLTPIDGRGKFLIPGLGDAHVHLPYQTEITDATFAQEDPQVLFNLFVAHGVTFVRNMGGSDYALQLRDEIDGGERLGPTVFTVGPMLSGTDTGLFQSLGEDADVDQIVADHKAKGYDAIKIHTQPNRDAFVRLTKAAHEANLPIVGHVPFTVGLTQTLEARLDRIEHIDLFSITIAADDAPGTGKGWPAMMERYNHPDKTKIAPLAKVLIENDVVLVPTLATTKIGEMSKDEVKALIDSESLANRTTQKLRDHWASRWLGEMQTYERAGLNLPGMTETPKLILERFIDAGVPMIAGTDTPAVPMIAGLALHEELADYVAAGMTPKQAIASSTSELAKAMWLEGEFGQIKPGLRADAVLLSANPLEDIANTQKIDAVLLRGKLLDREALDGLIDEVDTITNAIIPQ